MKQTNKENIKIYAGTSLDNFIKQYNPNSNIFIQDSEDPLNIFTSLKDCDLFFMIKQAEAHSQNKGGDPIIIKGIANKFKRYRCNVYFETCDEFDVETIYNIVEENIGKKLEEDLYVLKGLKNYSKTE